MNNLIVQTLAFLAGLEDVGRPRFWVKKGERPFDHHDEKAIALAQEKRARKNVTRARAFGFDMSQPTDIPHLRIS